MRQTETRGERPLPASDEFFDEAADQISGRNLLVFKTGFVYRNERALLDCTLTIMEPTVDYDFHEICEFQNFSVIKSSVSSLATNV